MIISWETLSRHTFAEAKAELIARSKRAENVSLRDLVALGETSERHNNGVYFFWKGSTPIYVGSAGSRSFVERVPAHFDPRSRAWFATLLKRLRERPLCDGRDPHEQAFDLQLSLLACDRRSKAHTPSELEAFFLASLGGTWLNSTKWVYVPDPNTPLEREILDWRGRRQRRR